MNKEAVKEFIEEKINRLRVSIDLVDSLDAKKIYKVVYRVYAWELIPGPKRKYHKVIKEEIPFFGKLDTFNTESIRFIALAIKKVKGTRFERDLIFITNSVKKDKPLKFSMKFPELYSIEEWKNLDTPQKEAAFLVNYEYVTHEFKKRCFNL